MLYALLTALLMLLAQPAFGVTGSGVTFSGVSAGASGGSEPPPSLGACTDGSDCFCDTFTSAHTILLCEDFEDVDYYENTAEDWAAGNGSPHNRGDDAEWLDNYPTGASFKSNVWSTDHTDTARVGTNCGFANPGCTGIKEYCSAAQGGVVDGGGADCWGPGINATAGLDIQREGDFDAEIGTLTLTGGFGVEADVGDGNAHMFYRVPAGTNLNDMGFSSKNFAASTSVGIIMLHAYSSNLSSTGILSNPWKHEEWIGSTASETFHNEHWNMGITGDEVGTYFPYQPFMWTKSTSACESNIGTATAHVGGISCVASVTALYMTAGANSYPIETTAGYPSACGSGGACVNSGVNNYVQSTDFPHGTWACHRAYITGMNTSSAEIKIWHNDVLVIHISGLNASAILDNNNYSNFWWNGYSNKHSTGGGTSATGGRYRDNVVILNGEPPTCASLGYL